ILPQSKSSTRRLHTRRSATARRAPSRCLCRHSTTSPPVFSSYFSDLCSLVVPSCPLSPANSICSDGLATRHKLQNCGEEFICGSSAGTGGVSRLFVVPVL